MFDLLTMLTNMVKNQTEHAYLRNIEVLRKLYGDEVADYIDDNMDGEPTEDGYMYFLMLDPNDAVERCNYMMASHG